MAPGDWIRGKSPSYQKAYAGKERRKLEIRALDHENPEKWLEEHKKRQLDKKNECTKRWREKSKAQIQEYRKKYRVNEDKTHRRKQLNGYYHKRKNTDLQYALANRMRNRLRQALKRGSKRSKSFDILGCTVDEWGHYLGATLEMVNSVDFEIDHIWPVSLYDLTDDREQKKAFNFRNTRICSVSENRVKHNSVPEPYLANSVPFDLWPPNGMDLLKETFPFLRGVYPHYPNSPSLSYN